MEESLKVSGQDFTEYARHARANLVSFGELVDDACLSHTSLYPILCGQLVGLWTAFEAICTDLWLAAVNASPNT
ncbi:MAG: hypothetical protein ACTHLN_12530, partial [Tepidisphaeraceae bacterium]